MNAAEDTRFHQITQFSPRESATERIELINEEPLLIRIEDKPYSVVMRTPGDEMAHAAGFCLGEGIADSLGDFVTIGYCKDLDPNVINVRLTDERREKIHDVLNRKGFVSQTSCGICGREMIADLHCILSPAQKDFKTDTGRLLDCMKLLSEKQHYYPRTRGTHAALLVDTAYRAMSFAEDVGRHNALDKSVGEALLNGNLSDAVLLVLSSRISYELVQKAARAKVPMILSKSRPTALAAEMAGQLNMTLACVVDNFKLMVVCGEHRLSAISY